MCVTYNYAADDSFENRPRHSWWRVPSLTSPAKLYDAHLLHLNRVNFEPVALDPADAPKRLVQVQVDSIEYLLEKSYLREDGEAVRGTLQLGVGTALPQLLPFLNERRPVLVFLYLLLVSAAGAGAAWGIGSHLPAHQEYVAACLFSVLALLSVIPFTRNEWLAWGYVCSPAALVLHSSGVTSWVPWVVAVVVVGVLANVIEHLRLGRERKRIQADPDALRRRTSSPPPTR